MYILLCGRGGDLAYTGRSHGTSLSPKRKRSKQAWRESGVSIVVWGWLDPLHKWLSHGAPLFPKRSKQDWRESGVSIAVWEWLDPLHTWLAHGAPLFPKQPTQA